MDRGETIILGSESQDYLAEESKRSIPGESLDFFNSSTNKNNDYDDIYFDKSYAAVEEMSMCNFSNLPKEIRLSEDNFSENQLFLKPDIPDIDLARKPSMSILKSLSVVVSDLEDED